jgi:Leu/Phe-tRNA-protein transferase
MTKHVESAKKFMIPTDQIHIYREWRQMSLPFKYFLCLQITDSPRKNVGGNDRIFSDFIISCARMIFHGKNSLMNSTVNFKSGKKEKCSGMKLKAEISLFLLALHVPSLHGGIQRKFPVGIQQLVAVSSSSLPPRPEPSWRQGACQSNERDAVWYYILHKYITSSNQSTEAYGQKADHQPGKNVGTNVAQRVHECVNEHDGLDDACDKGDSDDSGIAVDLCMPRGAMEKLHWDVLASNSWLWHYPLLVPEGIRERARYLAKHYKGKYCWATCFDPYFVASLMAEGFLPMAEEADSGPLRYLLVPKLHHQRSVLRFQNLHISRTVRKRSKRFDVTCDTNFEQVVEGCLRQHGANWLQPPIVEAFRRIFLSGGMCGVRVHSFEVWIADGLEGGTPNQTAAAAAEGTAARLVAGEIGYSVGACYTSLSGFSLVDSSGSVQCVAAALLLQLAGAEAWDLGMVLSYKARLGAAHLTRGQFLQDLARMRQRTPLTLPRGRINVQRLISLSCQGRASAPCSPGSPAGHQHSG